jgi:hypothetical protein
VGQNGDDAADGERILMQQIAVYVRLATTLNIEASNAFHAAIARSALVGRNAIYKGREQRFEQLLQE